MSHTKEPWRLCEHGSKTSLAGNTHGWHIERDDGTENGRMIVWEQINEDEGKRIVACVNACAGISTENLEQNRPVKWMAGEYNKALKEVAELRAEVARLKAAAVPAGWQPIETAPSDCLVVVGWIDQDDVENPDRYDFDYKEDGYWQRHEELREEYLCVALPECTGPKENAPYTHWMQIRKIPNASEPTPPQSADAEDAARYRWLRTRPDWLGYEHDFRPDEIDAAIDAARGGES